MKLTANQLRDGLKSWELAVDGDKAALMDRYAVINGESSNAAGNSTAAEPSIQHKVSVLSMTLERQSCIVSCKAMNYSLGCFTQLTPAGFAWAPFQSCIVLAFLELESVEPTRSW